MKNKTQLKIALDDADSHKKKGIIISKGKISKKGKIKGLFPNLVLMKLSAHHKKKGHKISWFHPIFGPYDIIYSSKVFVHSKSDIMLPKNTRKGGTGYSLNNTLPSQIEHIMPDYDLYGFDYSLGFLTRGCPRKCPWCVVPKKEGDIRAHADIEEFLSHKKVVLMDNNVLAHDHGINQIEKMSKMNLTIDFNQGIDARLIDNSIARLLSKLKWQPCVRIACDRTSHMKQVEEAVKILRKNGVTPKTYFCYVLVKDIDDALERVEFLRKIKVDPYAQPYLDKEGNPSTSEQKKFASWVNTKPVFKTVKWKDYNKKQNIEPKTKGFEL